MSYKHIDQEFESRQEAWQFASNEAYECEHVAAGDIIQTPDEWHSGLADGYIVKHNMDEGVDEQLLANKEYEDVIQPIQQKWEEFAEDIRTNYDDYTFEKEDMVSADKSVASQV